jgi:hypothetical protein
MNKGKVLLLEGFQNDFLMASPHLHTNILKKINEVLIPLFQKGWTILYAVCFSISSSTYSATPKKRNICVLGSYGAHLSSCLFVPSIQEDKNHQCLYVPYALDHQETSNNIFFHSANNKDPTFLKSILTDKNCSQFVLCGLHEKVLQETLQTAKNDLTIENIQCVLISHENDVNLLATLTDF